ncbi:unnamed protein product [Sphagnum jensenii]|uniref:Uncharacterized protein n=2 Tax=Sphagnum jensenii TaxID=128206 RepID=A0ABP1A200_9BRYO
MECNREEAVRAREIAERKFAVHDFSGAKKFLIKAQALFPELEGVSQMLAVVDVHSVAAVRVAGNEMNWYGILQVEQLADDSVIKRQYRKLALLLHPDKNKFAGAEAAFKLIGEAFGVLSDKQKRIAHDIRRRAKVQTHIPDPKSQFSTRHQKQPTHANAPPSHLTFWTSCPVCRTNFEYLRTFLDFQLTCQRCHRLFVARDMYAPHQNGANLPSGRGPANTVPPASSYQQQDFHFSTQGKGIGATVTGNGFACGGVGATNGNKVTEEAVPRKHPLKKKRGVGDDEEEDDDDDDDDEDEVFHPATSGTAGPGLSSNMCQAPRRSRRVKRNVMYMLDDSDDDDLEDFPASRKAGMHMATDRKPNGEWRDGMDEANGEQQQKRKFVDDGVESGSNIGDDRMEMGVREMDNKGGNSMAADIKESGDFNVLDTKEEAWGPLPEPNTVQLEVNVPPACTEDLCLSPESCESDQPNEVTVPDPDFHDFDADRTETNIQAGHFWAVYDDHDSMPRFYCRIDRVQLHPFKVDCHWLESVNHPRRVITGVNFRKVSPGVGEFKIAKAVDFNGINMFSHLMPVETTASKRLFTVYPKTGEVWAMYRMPLLKSGAQDKLQYEMAEIQTDFSVVAGVVGIVSLIKLDNFKTIWRPVGLVTQVEDLWRFSHRVPSFRLKGDESPGLAEDCWELDPASTC